MNMHFVVLAAFALAHAEYQESAPPKRARIALVTTGGKEAARSVLELAQARLASAHGIELLDRAMIERLLAEQKLTLSGLVDGATAAQAGKILSVDLFGVVEAAAGERNALGLVIYDAVTGTRLWDKALAGGELDKNAQSLAEGVGRAAAKWRDGLAKVKTVSLLAIRNADLPSDKNAFCQGLAAILERRLTSAPGMAVLERKRLEFINREKELVQGPAYKGLLSSLVLIDLQISRSGRGEGLKLLAILTDHQGRTIAKLASASEDGQVTKLLDPLVEQMSKALGVTVPPGAADTAREGQRFARESQLLLSHNQFLEALRAAESAFALAPDHAEHAALLSRCLTTVAIFLTNPTGMRTTYYGEHVIHVEADSLKAALRLARRGLEIRIKTLTNTRPRDRKALGKDEGVNILTTDTQRFFRNHLPFYDSAAFDAEAKELRREFLAASNRQTMAEINAWADVARADPSAFSAYTMHLIPRLGIIYEQAPGPGEFTATLDHVVRTWLAIGQEQDLAKMSLDYLVWFLTDLEHIALRPYPERWQYGLREQDNLHKLFQTMAGHRQPLIALCGQHGELELRWKAKQIDGAAAAGELHKIVASGLALIKAPPDWFHADYQVNCYKLLMSMVSYGYPHSPQQLFVVCKFMLDREEISADVVRLAFGVRLSKNDSIKQYFELLQQARALADSPRCRFLQKGTEVHVKRELASAWDAMMTAHPELRPNIPLPWDRVHTLLDAGKIDAGTRLQAVKAIGNQVYAAACGFEDDNKPVMQLVRVAAPDGVPQPLGKAHVTLPAYLAGNGRLNEGSWLNFVTGMAVGGDVAYVATKSDGIYAFPLNGAATRRIGVRQCLPREEITALALLDEKLYAGLANGYFISFDPAKESCTVLASSQRKERLAPFDDGSAFTIPYLVADPPRRRVLFILYQGMPSTANRTDGFWEYSAKSREFTQRVKLWGQALNEGSESRGGRIVLSAFLATYVVSYDLERNQAAMLTEPHPIGPDLKTPDLQKRQERFDAYPYLCQDGWVWTARPFGRKAADGSKREVFPALPVERPWTVNPFTPRWMERLEEGPWVLVGDSGALWVVRLKVRQEH